MADRNVGALTLLKTLTVGKVRIDVQTDMQANMRRQLASAGMQ